MIDGVMSLLQDGPPIRRNRKGELYQMNRNQRKASAELIHKECCNYCDGWCLLLESIEGEPSPCVQHRCKRIICRWFQNAVLPLQPELEKEIYRDTCARTCQRCGGTFHADGNHAKYCADCSKTVRRIKSRAYAREHRLRKRQNEG